MAELAHHRRPARRRTRHTHAQRPRPSGSPPVPQTWGVNRAAGAGQRAAEPAVHRMNPLAAIRPAGGPPLSWLRALPLLARPIILTMPWVTLITGCLAGTVFLAIMAHVAGSSHLTLSQGTVRLAFLPAVAALAFILRAPLRALTQATPG